VTQRAHSRSKNAHFFGDSGKAVANVWRKASARIDKRTLVPAGVPRCALEDRNLLRRCRSSKKVRRLRTPGGCALALDWTPKSRHHVQVAAACDRTAHPRSLYRAHPRACPCRDRRRELASAIRRRRRCSGGDAILLLYALAFTLWAAASTSKMKTTRMISVSAAKSSKGMCAKRAENTKRTQICLPMGISTARRASNLRKSPERCSGKE
jgi:ribosomal protein S14